MPWRGCHPKIIIDCLLFQKAGVFGWAAPEKKALSYYLLGLSHESGFYSAVVPHFA